EDERDPVDLMAEDYIARLKRGEAPSIGKYVARHPEHAEAIRELFEAMRLVEDLKPDSELVSGTTSEPISSGRAGRFELIAPIGSGSFGMVWQAHDPDLNRTVAVKIPRKEQLTPDTAEKFLHEARACAQLRHPGIVGVHEVGRTDEAVYIVSDYVPGP